MPAPLTTEEFRRALGQFATGVTVITVASAPGVSHGMTANAVTSVSLEPRLVLVCIDERALTLPLIQEKGRFGINVLREEQKSWSELFARPQRDENAEKRLGICFRWSASGVPLLEEVLARLTCRVLSSHVAGDHTIFIAEVAAAEVFSGRPLVFYGGTYCRLDGEL